MEVVVVKVVVGCAGVLFAGNVEGFWGFVPTLSCPFPAAR